MAEEKTKRRSRETIWVRTLVPLLSEALGDGGGLRVVAGFRLVYRHEIHSYNTEDNQPALLKSAGYQTDLLVSENIEGGWIPRIVVECKLGQVTTHDALTYSAKAATHKHVHPYLRYGILIGELDHVPTRLVQHGTQFDFMAVWPRDKASVGEWRAFVKVLREEMEASRLLESLMGRGRRRQRHTLIHRPINCPNTD
jgi:hypothetical protein